MGAEGNDAGTSSGNSTATADAATAAKGDSKAAEQVLGPDGAPLSLERAATALKDLPALKAKAARADELEAELKQINDAKLSDAERLQNRVSELEAEKLGWEQERQNMLVGNAVRDAAAKAGARYPEAVVKLIDFSTLEFDKAGLPKNLDKQVEAISQSYPEMFNGTSPGRVAQGVRTPAAGADFNTAIREAARR